MSEKITIDISDNGPFIITGLEKLRNSRGEMIECKEKMALCRCGGSSNKPFCDGTHSKNGFSGERMSEKNIHNERSYEGKDITINDNRTICSHSAECVKNLNKVFDTDKKPWITPDNATAEEIMKVIKRCPSGALSYTVSGRQVRNFDREKEITVSKNGPYNVKGGIHLNVEKELQPPASEHFALCRCGASKNKPYCDGSHSGINFTDESN